MCCVISYLDLTSKYSNLLIVFLTGVLAYFTYRLIAESRIERINQKMPVVVFRFRHIRHMDRQQLVEIETQERIVNIGSGPALNIQLRTNGELGGVAVGMLDKDEDGLMPWPSGYIVDNVLGPDSGDPDMQICFARTSGDVSLLKNPKLILKATYNDVFGRQFKTLYKNCENKFEMIA